LQPGKDYGVGWFKDPNESGVRFMIARSSMPRSAMPIIAGIAYFALVFALGFLLGTLRTLIVRDAPGATRLLGVVIELPIMLSASWFLCAYVIQRFAVASTVTSRAIMGGLAFVLLLSAELVVGALLFHRTPNAHFALYRDLSYALGLVAQIGFAAMPLLQLRRDKSGERGTTDKLVLTRQNKSRGGRQA
jgi:hypothetical protein